MLRSGRSCRTGLLWFLGAWCLTLGSPLMRDAGVAHPGPAFEDITEAAGIQWRHFNGESEDRFLIETMCGGVGLADFDNDGLLDIYLVNGGETPKGKSSTPVRNALYRNLGSGRFENIAGRARVDAVPFYGMGVASADYDNDGSEDLYVSGFPSSALFHNNGDGTFVDVTDKSGVKNAGEWGAGAAWFDFDRDGYLDLFVCNYAKLSFATPSPCDYQGKPNYCDPKVYEGRPARLYHNNRNGTFADVTETAGIRSYVGRAFGVVSVDANGDGWPDLFVASDMTPNLLLINRGNGTFEDQAFEAGVAYNNEGVARSGMGVDTGDVNGDGWPDFVVTNFHDQDHALYLNPGRFPYEERPRESGMSRLTRPYVGWGVRLFDYDNDGDLDLMIVNGHVTSTIELIRRDISYKEPPLLLANDGAGRFQDMGESGGAVFRQRYSARGLAVGDIDNDGDPDAVFASLNERPVVMRNREGQSQPWIGFALRGVESNRSAIGAKLTLRAGERKIVRWISGGGSFLASHDKRIIFGLGSQTPSDRLQLEILWPNGAVQEVSGLSPNRYHTVVQRLTPQNR